MSVWAPLRASRASRALTLGAVVLLAAGAGRAGAEAVPPLQAVSYIVSGEAGGEGASGGGSIRFVGPEGGTLYDPKSTTGMFSPPTAGPPGLFTFDLGSFVIEAPPAGETARYVDTPFALTARSDGGAPVALEGTLNATVSRSGVTGFMVTLDKNGFVDIPNIWDAASSYRSLALPIEAGGIAGMLLNGLTILSPTAGATPGTTRVRVMATMFPVPEPASWVVVLSLSAGLLFRRRLQARR